MTTCDESTRDALRAAMMESGLSQRAWARANHLPVSTVNDCLLRKSVSERRENELRDMLQLPLIHRTPVILRDTERIVKRPGYGKKRGYVEFKIRVSEEDAKIIRKQLAAFGYRSFSEWWNQNGLVYRLRDTEH